MKIATWIALVQYDKRNIYIICVLFGQFIIKIVRGEFIIKEVNTKIK